ncbi:MAG: hypothetical protein ACK5UB_03925, partial [Pseudanabaena sp.]
PQHLITKRSPPQHLNITIASPKKSNSDRPSTPKNMIASTQKTNSDRLINPKNYDRLFTKTKQRSPLQNPNHDRLYKKSNSDRSLNTSISQSPLQKNKTAITILQIL